MAFGGPIPKVIHHVWVGPPMPAHVAEWRATWARHHPDWDHILWGDNDLWWLTRRPLYDHAADIVPTDAVGQFRADIARYEILLKYGGLYVDADTEALAPIDEILGGATCWAAAEDPSWIGNTYLAATPGHPVMVDLVAGLEASVARNRGARANVISGPKYLTPIWRAHGCPIGPTARFYPYSYRDVRNGTVPTVFGADVVAVHHWAHTRQVLEARR